MKFTNYLFSCILLFFSLSSFAQRETVFMKWKIQPGEAISYKTIMREIDTSNQKNPSFGFMDKMVGDSIKDQFKNILKQLNREMGMDNLVTSLTGKNKGLIDIEMRANKDTATRSSDTSKQGSDFGKFKDLMGKLSDGVTLRGVISEDGIIKSFYTASAQKNIIAAFFELPGKPIKIGDSWPLDVSFISMDQNFVCDSSYKVNRVTAVAITNKNNEHIVTLKYDIIEYVDGTFGSPFGGPVKTSMKITYQAMADFSIEKGRWISYDGVMSSLSTGIMSAQSKQKFSLVAE